MREGNADNDFVSPFWLSQPHSYPSGPSHLCISKLKFPTNRQPKTHCRSSIRTANFDLSMRPIRVLVAKPGLDGHDRGAKVVAAALRDAGMEVIYTGLHQTPEMIATAAVQEDVDVIGLSILSGAHMTLIPRVQELVRAQGRDDILITGGGIIPREDVDALQAQGVGRLFGPGTPTSELIAYIKEWFQAREKQEA